MNERRFEEGIYVGENNPYVSWLKATTEKELYGQHLPSYLSDMRIGQTMAEHASVLDLGCGFGSTAKRLMRALHGLGIAFDYTGVDPYEEQLRIFAESEHEDELPTPRLMVGDIESYVPDRAYTLVHASHSLYYTHNMPAALERLVSFGREIIIVHHGWRGINEFHQRFRSEIKPGPYIISTDEDVVENLSELDLGGRRVRRRGLLSTVNITPCFDPSSRDGQNLLAFFFERTYESIAPSVLAAARSFLQATWPNGIMGHGMGIFLITDNS